MQKTLAINAVLALAQAVQVDTQSEAQLQAALELESELDANQENEVEALMLAQQYRTRQGMYGDYGIQAPSSQSPYGSSYSSGYGGPSSYGG